MRPCSEVDVVPHVECRVVAHVSLTRRSGPSRTRCVTAIKPPTHRNDREIWQTFAASERANPSATSLASKFLGRHTLTLNLHGPFLGKIPPLQVSWRVVGRIQCPRPFRPVASKNEKKMPPRPMSTRSRARKRSRVRSRTRKKDPIFVDGHRPRPMYVDYKDVELLKKMVNRQGRIVGRRKTGCTAASQHAVSAAIKRARYMALMPYVGE